MTPSTFAPPTNASQSHSNEPSGHLGNLGLALVPPLVGFLLTALIVRLIRGRWGVYYDDL